MKRQHHQPVFSVIIPTYNRPGPLAACLEALARLDYPRDRFEVIVVDDGSRESPEAVVAPFRTRMDVTWLAQSHGGPGVARNTGAAQARGEFLAFTDDDCAPAADWLTALAARCVAAPREAIGGQTVNALTGAPCAEASQLLIDYLYAYYHRANTGARQPPFFTTSNLALPRDDFWAIGGFDERKAPAIAEDRELCRRWVRRGFRLTYAPEARVYHAHRQDLREFCRLHFRYGRGAFRFHRLEAGYARTGLRPEPWSFYRDLMCYPLGQRRNPRAVVLMLLLGLSQVANAAGYVAEGWSLTR